jgi:hypothetical protein
VVAVFHQHAAVEDAARLARSEAALAATRRVGVAQRRVVLAVAAAAAKGVVKELVAHRA